jgi:Mrp family chromosome partitioning ATPase
MDVVPVGADWGPDSSLTPAARRALRDELRARANDSCLVIAVSGLPGTSLEKSRVAAELALSFGEVSGLRVLFMEGNLQKPLLHRLLHFEMPALAGLSEQLDARAHSSAASPWTVLQCGTLHVLGEGVMRMPELIVSRHFAACVSELRSAYDFIVIDGPLSSELAACRAIHEVVDGAIVVQPASGEAPISTQELFPGKRLAVISAAG